MPARPSPYDAIIVGARCAGASTAMLLARQGARVVVIDHDQPGTDTMSTHALMRSGVLQLHRWGILDSLRACGTPPIRKTSFFYGAEAIEVDIGPAHGTDALFAPRRTVLDAALVEAAWNAGASFRFGTGCKGLVRDGSGRVTGIEVMSGQGRSEVLSAEIVIGADGRRSAIAREVASPALRSAAHSSTVTYGYVEGIGNLGYRWFWGNHAAGGIIPTNNGLSCVFLSSTPERFVPVRDPADFAAAIAKRLPVMAEQLADGKQVSRPVTFRGERGYVRQSCGPGWALVGDAGYFKDPITAHGITDALRDAELLATAYAAGTLQAYPEIRDDLSRDFFQLTDRIASYDWSLDAIKTLHVDLNKAMKRTQRWIVDNLHQRPLAA